MPRVLGRPWRELDWHVDNRCIGCDYLGYPWPNRIEDSSSNCFPRANVEGHLSQIAFLPIGASSSLRAAGLATVPEIAAVPSDDSRFDRHQTLRASRTVIGSRASALIEHSSRIAPLSGTSALMPRWADLRVFVTCDFDVSSGITLSFMVSAVHIARGKPPRRHQPVTFTTSNKTTTDEGEQLIAFLDAIQKIFDGAKQRDPDASVQLYLWDELQFKHLTRVIGRHLALIIGDRSLDRLAWLFPPDELLANPRTATRRQPITIVRDVVRSVAAIPIPHYYSLLNVARQFHTPDTPEYIAKFSVHPLFEDPLSDQIPSERAHEIWTREKRPGREWAEQIARLVEAGRRRHRALESVVRRLEGELGTALGLESDTAPRIREIGPPQYESRISNDGQLWLAFARLDSALRQLDVAKIRAMPAHEREARFKSARLPMRLDGQRHRRALELLDLEDRPERYVYELGTGSREVRAADGEIKWALSPEADARFLDRSLKTVVGNSPLNPRDGSEFSKRMEKSTSVNIVRIDRQQGLLIVDNIPFQAPSIEDLERGGFVDLSTSAVLDPVHVDTLTDKVRRALREIGNPRSAVNQPLVDRATGMAQAGRRGARSTPDTPASEVLWEAGRLSKSVVDRNLDGVREQLEAAGLELNESQWCAWKHALTHQLALIWGPPGTGKSRTLRNIVLGAILASQAAQEPLRILITALTYNAVDNVLLASAGFRATGSAVGLLSEVRFARLRSRQAPRTSDRNVQDIEVDWFNPSQELSDIGQSLTQPCSTTVIGGTPQQIHNLLRSLGAPSEELFDLIIIDEASQLDVANLLLVAAARSAGSSVVVAGDPKQLPPIHEAEAPRLLGAMVGSTYQYFAEIHGVSPQVLNLSYRSNETLLAFTRLAGYPPTLASHSPDLQIRLTSAVPLERPAAWPNGLPWSEAWREILDPGSPAVAFVYKEGGKASQWNEFEASCIAAAAFLLRSRLARGLDNETGKPATQSPKVMEEETFWREGVGIVTPHRAQQALAVQHLCNVFPDTSERLIRDAVDTVERFQGQQRDVIIASFALGDPDAIRDEDEFLLSLNRFNVLASRARAKLIVFVSQEVVAHLATDIDVLRDSRLLKAFVESFCANPREVTFMRNTADGERREAGLFKSR